MARTVRVALLLCDTPVSPPAPPPRAPPAHTAQNDDVVRESGNCTSPRPRPRSHHRPCHLLQMAHRLPRHLPRPRRRPQHPPHRRPLRRRPHESVPPARETAARRTRRIRLCHAHRLQYVPPHLPLLTRIRTHRIRHIQPLHPPPRPLCPLPRLLARVPAPQTHRHLFRPPDPLHRPGRRVRPRTQRLGNWRLRMPADRPREVLVDRRRRGPGRWG